MSVTLCMRARGLCCGRRARRRRRPPRGRPQSRPRRLPQTAAGPPESPRQPHPPTRPDSEAQVSNLNATPSLLAAPSRPPRAGGDARGGAGSRLTGYTRVRRRRRRRPAALAGGRAPGCPRPQRPFPHPSPPSPPKSRLSLAAIRVSAFALSNLKTARAGCPAPGTAVTVTFTPSDGTSDATVWQPEGRGSPVTAKIPRQSRGGCQWRACGHPSTS